MSDRMLENQMVLPYHDDESIPEPEEPDPDEAYDQERADRDHAAQTTEQVENDGYT